MTSCSRACRWLLPALLAAGCSESASTFTLAGNRYSSAGLEQWALPEELREVSGLAQDAAGRLFAHDDEVAWIFELDPHAGRVVRRFALGSPPARGDFEGIAWVGSRLFLVTSDGDLLEGTVAADGASADYRLHRTGLGRRCEIEGLDFDPERRLLLMCCKTPREKALEGRVGVLAWSPDTRVAAPQHDLLVPVPSGAAVAELQPSGLTRSAPTGHLILVAARQRALLELTPQGTLVQAFRLPDARVHPQMEGVVMAATGALIIADEGNRGRGRLSVYSPAR